MKERVEIQRFLNSPINSLSNENPYRNFNEVKDKFDLIRNYIIEMINTSETFPLPSEFLEQIIKAAAEWTGYFSRMTSFNPVDDKGFSSLQNIDRQKKQIETDVKKWMDDSLKGSNSFLTIYNSIKLLSQPTAELLISQMDNLKIQMEAKRVEAENTLKRINEILSDSQKASGKIGLNSYAKTFEEEANENRDNAKLWLKYIIGVLILIPLIAVTFYYFSPENDASNIKIVNYAITKILAFTALFYGLSVCLKNYKAFKHNEILNRHRQNALNTFQTFVASAAEDNQTKNAVLLEATHSIFSNQQTGYLSKDADNESSNKIIEIIKSVSSNNS